MRAQSQGRKRSNMSFGRLTARVFGIWETDAEGEVDAGQKENPKADVRGQNSDRADIHEPSCDERYSL